MSWKWARPPRVVGHRGAPYDAPENTLASFAACVAGGVRAVELDARLSSDGRVVVHHDAELGRVIEGVGAVEATASEALSALGVPLLEEVLALPLAIDIELKADAANAGELPARVLALVRSTRAEDRVLVTSFDAELADAYARLAGTPAGMILPFAPEPGDLESWPRLTHVALAQDAAIPEALDVLRRAGRTALVWTVNDERVAASLRDVSLITDRPMQLARFLSEGASGP